METESDAEFRSMVDDLRANNFVDMGTDATAGKSLRDNLRGPQGKTGPPGPVGITGPQAAYPERPTTNNTVVHLHTRAPNPKQRISVYKIPHPTHIKEGIVSPPSFHHRRGTKGRSVRLGRRAWLVPGARPVREGRKASVA